MTKNTSPTINQNLVRELASLLDELELSEIEYRNEGLTIRVKKSQTASSNSTDTIEVEKVNHTNEQFHSTLPPSKGLGVGLTSETISAPMVGIVYTSPDSNSPPFVKVGDLIAENQTVLLVEAMKVFNQIKAPKAGKVTKIFVENGSPVEFGEPLIAIS